METIEAKRIHIRFTRALSSYDNHAMPNAVSARNSLLSSLIKRKPVTGEYWKSVAGREDSPEH